MKIKQLAVALATLSVSAVSFAAGVTPTQISNAKTAGTLDQAWISGASAPARSIYEGWVKGCNPGTNSIFTNNATSSTSVTPGSLGNFVAYACVRSGNRTSVLYHTMDGGSLNAFTPFTNGTKLGRLTYLPSASCTKSATGFVDSTNTANDADIYNGCSRTGAAVALDATGVQTATNKSSNAAAIAADPNGPQATVGGFSDVEPTLFSSTIGGGNVSAVGTLSNAFIGQAFGVAVSIPLYRALQAAQDISESGSAFDPASAPSLTKGQIASILQDGGAVVNADSWAPILGDDPGQKVIVQRRVDTSGTQASSNVFFLGNPCTGKAQLVPAAANSSNFLVFKQSSTGGVKSGITSASNSTDTTAQFAIGVLSMENNWRTEDAANGGYRYIKIDGVHPEAGDAENARLGAAAGTYPFHMEMKAFVAKSAPVGFQRSIVTTIVTALKNPVVSACATLPRGLTLNPASGNTTCQSGVVKAKFTNFGNNCSPATLYE